MQTTAPQFSHTKFIGIVAVSLVAVAAVGFVIWQQNGQTKLVVDVPDADREHVELIVDGKQIWLRDSGPIEIPGSWGRRTINVRRPKYRPIRETLSLEYGERKMFVPQWQSLEPPALRAPFTYATAKDSQEAWATFLNRPSRVKNAIGMEFVLIPPGEFRMGVVDSEYEWAILVRSSDWSQTRVAAERPSHYVRITKPFYMQATEVTVGQFRQFVNETGYRTEGEKIGHRPAHEENASKPLPGEVWNSPKFTATDDHPVAVVTWNDAVAFAAWLHAKDGKFYRLPTEAQWEYSCRAGTATKWFSGDEESGLEDYAWYSANSAGETHPVAQKKPNSFGLFDMHGNVWEWCADWADPLYYRRASADDPAGPPTGDVRIVRGGRCLDGAVYIRSGCRHWYEPAYRNRTFGFRLARTYD